jgi:hypothetical protein
MNSYAPIVIPTLNRFEHLKRCITSLSECNLANETELFVVLDFPKFERHKEGFDKIKEYLPQVIGFKAVNIIARETNFGSGHNARRFLWDYICKNYETFIFTEDDNIFSKSFLEHINNGLKIYKNDPEIFGICSYNDPIEMPQWYEHDVYLRTGCVGWGTGYYTKKYLEIDWNINTFKNQLENPKNLSIIKKFHLKAIPQLFKMRDTGELMGDGIIFMHMLSNNMKSVYPVKSLVKNIGHDGSGEHCGVNKTYEFQQIFHQDSPPIIPNNLLFDQRLRKYMAEKLSGKFSKRFRIHLLMLPKPVGIFLTKLLNFFQSFLAILKNKIK